MVTKKKNKQFTFKQWFWLLIPVAYVFVLIKDPTTQIINDRFQTLLIILLGSYIFLRE